MKKLVSLVAVILVFTLVFAACSSEENTEGTGNAVGSEVIEFEPEEYYENEYENSMVQDELDENVVLSVNDLANFFLVESPENLGEKYGYLFYMARNDNYVVRPLIDGEDVSQQEGFSQITIVPPEKDGDYSYIMYGYTNGTYNYNIKVYYLYEQEYNVAMVGGLNALNNGDEEVIERENYGKFTIVKNLPNDTSHAEFVLRERYFIVITGAKITNTKFPDVIEKEALDILAFDEIQIAEG